MDNPFGSPQPQPGHNPYAAPSTSPYGGYAPAGMSQSEAERIRRELIANEVSIKSIGSLYLVSAFFCGFGGLALAGLLIFSLISPHEAALSLAFSLGLLLLYVLIGAVFFWIGKGLRQLDIKVRTITIVLSAIGLIGFPLGTLINGYFLYLLAGEKGKRIFSPEYQEIIRATPHIQHKSPWLLGCAIILVVGVVIAAIVYFTAN